MQKVALEANRADEHGGGRVQRADSGRWWHDGCRVLFWHDVWRGELPLKILFLALFSIACTKEA